MIYSVQCADVQQCSVRPHAAPVAVKGELVVVLSESLLILSWLVEFSSSAEERQSKQERVRKRDKERKKEEKKRRVREKGKKRDFRVSEIPFSFS